MNTITFRGPSAELRWSYYVAATLGPWSIDGTTLTATVTELDALRASQQPLTFVVPRTSGESWRWSIQSLQLAGMSLTATISPL